MLLALREGKALLLVNGRWLYTRYSICFHSNEQKEEHSELTDCSHVRIRLSIIVFIVIILDIYIPFVLLQVTIRPGASKMAEVT